MFGFLSEGPSEIEDVFDGGWLGEVMVNGWSVRELVWCLNVKMGLNSGTSSGGDRMQECHPACDPTILEAREEVDLKLG